MSELAHWWGRWWSSADSTVPIAAEAGRARPHPRWLGRSGKHRRATLSQALADARAAETALEELRAAAGLQPQLEEARFTLQQIEAVNPEGGEYEETRIGSPGRHAEVLARNSPRGRRGALRRRRRAGTP
ncbi:MAG: hypothetical protein ACLUW6_00135 [Coriobacteriaceae bacterium]